MKIMRIDEADPVPREEPDFSIRTLRDLWGEVADSGKTPYSVGTIENCCFDQMLRIFASFHCGCPGVDFGTGDSNEAAGHVQPQPAIVVLDHLVDRVAGQSVFAGQRGQTIVLQTAQPAFSGDPERALVIK